MEKNKMNDDFAQLIANITHDISNLQSIWKEDSTKNPNPYPIDYQGLNSKSIPLVKEFELMRNKHVLDIGCNSGLYSYLMGSVAKSVLGCDIDSQLLHRAESAREFFRTYYDNQNVIFYHGNFADKLDDNVDAILASCVLYHIGDDNLKLLFEFLSKSFCAVIIQTRPQREDVLKIKKWGALKIKKWGSVSNTKMYDSIYTIESNLNFLKDCGYDKVDVLGLRSTEFYGETFPILIARK